MEIGKAFRFGLGAATIILAATGIALAQSAPSEPTGDLAFGRSIALIRGHLLAGEELVKLHDWNIAYQHFSFPREEIYGVIREELRTYNTPSFDFALKELARAVRSHSIKQYSRALQKVDAALAAADTALKARQLNWPKFTIAVAMEVLKTAADEYDDAIANGRIIHSVGYRTARGFVLQADRMIESAAAELPAGDSAALADIRTEMTKIKELFPGPRVPERPSIDEKALEESISRIELSFQKLAASRQI